MIKSGIYNKPSNVLRESKQYSCQLPLLFGEEFYLSFHSVKRWKEYLKK